MNYYKSVHTYILGFAKDTFKLKFQASFNKWSLSGTPSSPAPPPPTVIKTRTPAVAMPPPTFSDSRFFVPSCLHSIAQSTVLFFFHRTFFIVNVQISSYLKIKSVLFSFKVLNVLSCVTQKVRAWLFCLFILTKIKNRIKVIRFFLKDCLILWLYVRTLLKILYFL